MLRGTLQVPGDKSITHRAIIFASLAAKKSVIIGGLLGDDCLATIACFRQLGVTITIAQTQITIDSPGVHRFVQPSQPLDCQNSGTTARLLMGILAALPFETLLIGDASLSRRPMRRVVEPLTLMGAKITLSENGTLPATIVGSKLRGIHYESPIASAQVKSAILLAGLFASGTTSVREPEQSRDHTERFFELLAYDWQQLSLTHVQVNCCEKFVFPDRYHVPGDISSAAFWCVGASMIEKSDVTLTHVGLNPTRMGIIVALQAMGATIEIERTHDIGEPVGNIRIRASKLQAIQLGGAVIPTLIDEIPILVLAMSQAVGVSRILDASELRVKESDRIEVTTNLLLQLGADVQATTDGFIVTGPKQLVTRGSYDSHGDHRLAMLLLIVQAYLTKKLDIINEEAYTVSYPQFMVDLERISKQTNV